MQVPHRKGENDHLVPQDYHLSPEKFQSLERQLIRLKKRQPIEASEVKRLAEMGDFSENAGYQLAKSRLRGLNSRVSELENLLKRAEIILPDADVRTIKAGHHVTIEKDGLEKTFLILGATETDPAAGVISLLSPLGSALLGKHAGEEIHLAINGREQIYKIIKIEA